MCCLFKVTWPRLHLWFTEPNYFSPRATGSVRLWKEREEETKGKEGGRESERKNETEMSWWVGLCSASAAKGTRPDEELTYTRFLSSRTLVSSFILGEAGKVSTAAGAAHKWVSLALGTLSKQCLCLFFCFFFLLPLFSPSTSSLFSAARARKTKERHFWVQPDPIPLSGLIEDRDWESE